MSRAGQPRRALVRALAKLNLDLRVLGKRPDGYHELRTIFQTISLADRIEIAFQPSRSTEIELEDAAAIPDNLVERAARAVMQATGATGHVAMRLHKYVPMGAGLGGGSSDAAAVLLALPVLAGAAIELPKLCRIGAELGSDVPFFLLGGAAAGFGRGTELVPLAAGGRGAGVLVAPGVHISTAEAYSLLSSGLTIESQQNKIFSFQSHVWAMPAHGCAANDFEPAVFRRHPSLAAWKRRLERSGAKQAMMTGSGSAVFGLFDSASHAARAATSLAGTGNAARVLRFSMVSRAQYRSLWWRALKEHMSLKVWPPQSRYLR